MENNDDKLNVDKNGKYSYFQYFRSQGIPVYIKLVLSDFSVEMLQLLKDMQFTEVEGTEEEQRVEALVKAEPQSKLLTISLATPGVAKQIGRSKSLDSYGNESITPRDGYRVYRMRNTALIVYSFAINEWNMGCFDDFGKEENLIESRIVINRFLSWALFTGGIIGLWGVPVDEGMVLQRMNDSHGEAVFFDINKKCLYTVDGKKKVKQSFSFIKLDKLLRGRNVYFSREEFFSTLSIHCAFFEYSGHNTAVRQMINVVGQSYDGFRHPEESFRPRSENEA